LPIAQQRSERLGWIIEQLTLAALAKGQVFSVERLRINAEDLIDIPKESLEIAFGKARRELDFIPGVAELRRLAGVGDADGTIDAEARAAWEMLEVFVKRYVDCDVFGNYGPEYGWYPKTYPLLSERIMATIRRTGGWSTYKLLTDQNFPFQQKRFFDEYKAFALTQPIADTGRLLVMEPRKELDAVSVPAPHTKLIEKCAPPPVAIKPVPREMTAEQERDRREMLRQQTEILKARYGKEKT